MNSHRPQFRGQFRSKLRMDQVVIEMTAATRQIGQNHGQRRRDHQQHSAARLTGKEFA